MAAIRPTRTRTAIRTYADENTHPSQSHPAHAPVNIFGKPTIDGGLNKSQLQAQEINVNVNVLSDKQHAGKQAGVGAAGVKRPALASKDQQPPRKVSKHTRSSSVTSKPERRAPTVPLGTSNSLNITASTSTTTVNSRHASVSGSSRQPSIDRDAFSDAPTLTTLDEEREERKLSGTSSGSGLTPSLTELGVHHAGGQAGDDHHPSSSRYGDVGGDVYQMGSVDVLSIPEETEEDVQRSQQQQHQLQMQLHQQQQLHQYHLEDASNALLSDQAVDAYETELAAGSEIDEEEHELRALEQDDWLCLTRDQAVEVYAQLEDVKSKFVDEVDELDCTMVAEYADEIFDLMGRLERQSLPSGNYMDHQHEMDWGMRTTLIDWLLQVHLRYHMLPETLWIAVNIVDRFLSARVVSLIKLQLVGVTAMFIAAKYEEILAPSVEEFVYMTEGGYNKEEILKGERIILQTLKFDISSYCSPYSWVRKISKADDYDVQTRTLSKYLMEVTLLDHRFLRAKPSVIAAIGMYLARRMLDGDWSDGFIFYSGFTEVQLITGARILTEIIAAPAFGDQYVYRKYAHKKFLRASQFAGEWARAHVVQDMAIF